MESQAFLEVGKHAALGAEPHIVWEGNNNWYTEKAARIGQAD